MAINSIQPFRAQAFGGQLDPVGALFTPIHQALAARREEERFQRTFAEDKRRANRDFELRDRAVGVQESQFRRAVAEDGAKAARARATSNSTQLSEFGKLIGELTGTGQQVPPSLAAMVDSLKQETAASLGAVGVSDPQGRAELLFQMSSTGAANMNPEEFRNAQKLLTDTATRLLVDDGMEVAQIEGVLNSMVETMPEMQNFVGELISGLPSQAEYRAGVGRGDAQETGATIEGLSQIPGVDRDAAIKSELGGGQTINIDTGGESGGQIDKVMRRELQTRFDASVGLLESARASRAQINDQTVGLWAGVSRTVGAAAQQTAITKTIANTIGAGLGLDTETVNKALTARSQFLQTMGQMANYVLDNDDRLTNPKIEILRRASNLEKLTSNPDVAIATMDQIISMTEDLQSRTAGQLRSGDVFFGTDFGTPQTPVTTRAEPQEDFGDLESMPFGVIIEDEHGNRYTRVADPANPGGGKLVPIQ